MRNIIIAFMACTLSLGSCHSNVSKSPAKKYKYYCTMHPDIGADKPGICPKCGMELVERDTTAK
ncbi:MAG: heavy metal-binding domain-containing protein [Mucilaginibacter sp.]